MNRPRKWKSSNKECMRRWWTAEEILGDDADAKFGQRGEAESAGRHVGGIVLPTIVPLL
jgi:hypothetical protein